ncbi:MAG TPA: hypothetical protein VD838_04895 [Anaeromyxobacteraceae bacterium]|nr:hypothetical protein [Anaeromyxobacteraceae bacterium]
MIRSALILVALLSAAVPASALALLPNVEVSVGTSGSYAADELERDPTSIMVAPGVGLLPMLSFHVGLLTRPNADRGDDVDIDVRPMLTIKPPLFPLYARGIVAIPTVIDGTKRIDAGGALGLKFGLFGVSIFSEVAYLANVKEYGTTAVHPDWIVDGRIGLAFE